MGDLVVAAIGCGATELLLKRPVLMTAVPCALCPAPCLLVPRPPADCCPAPLGLPYTFGGSSFTVDGPAEGVRGEEAQVHKDRCSSPAVNIRLRAPAVSDVKRRRATRTSPADARSHS